MSTPVSSKNFFTHVAEYTNTTEGAWDTFRVAEQTCSLIKHFPSLTDDHAKLLKKISRIFSSVGLALSIPRAISNVNTLVKSFSNLFFSTDLPYSDSLRSEKINQAFKTAFVEATNFGNTVSQIGIFLHQIKLHVLNPMEYRLLDAFFNVTSLICDSADLVSQCFKLKKYQSIEQLPHNELESMKLLNKKNLAWLTIIQDTSAIALSIIGLAGIVFGSAVESITVLPVIGLFLGTTWLALKICNHFYKTIVINQPVPIKQ